MANRSHYCCLRRHFSMTMKQTNLLRKTSFSHSCPNILSSPKVFAPNLYLSVLLIFLFLENIFEVLLSKGSRGLGLSVTGGIDCPNEPWPGIIRIKRLFPHQPAWQDGKLAPGDVLLEADGTRLTGLTNYVSRFLMLYKLKLIS